jgi:hypothetical protein
MRAEARDAPGRCTPSLAAVKTLLQKKDVAPCFQKKGLM